MPRITDLARVRAILESDRPWAAYALGDLSPGLVEQAEWFVRDDDRALLLLLHAFDPPILFALGEAEQVIPLFDEITVPALSLHVRPEILSTTSTLLARYRATWLQPMWRMLVTPDQFRPVDPAGVVALGSDDVGAIVSLFGDGRANGETPHFFFPSMVTQGIFRGIWEGSELVAVAGTHMVDALYGVCAIGNVYVRRDRRRQGLAARATGAVAEEAIERGLSTIVLNVGQQNDTAARTYQRLGFRTYCAFVEGALQSLEDSLVTDRRHA
jgi:ribosomal protein S18 acetylase RimI-like enzyme